MPFRNRLSIIALVGLPLFAETSLAEKSLPIAASVDKVQQIKPSSTPSDMAKPYSPFPELSSEECYNAKDHDAADLCAQWRAAFAAEKAANVAEFGNWINGVGAFLSLASLLAVGVSLYLTRAALVETRKSTRASQRAIIAAEKTAEKELRAYLRVSIQVVSWTDGKFKTTIKNVGPTPARNVRQAATVFSPAIGQQPIFESGIPADQPPKGIVFPEQEIETSVSLPSPLGDNDRARVKSGERTLYIDGVVLYQDSFGKDRSTTFRGEFSGRSCIETLKVKLCREGNNWT